MNDQYILFYDSVGTLLSKGDGSAPFNVGYLNASTNETSAPIKVTIKILADFKTKDSTELSFTGATAAKWQMSETSGGTYSSSITFASEITEAGTDFWIKASASSDETPSNDVSVDMNVDTQIVAV